MTTIDPRLQIDVDFAISQRRELFDRRAEHLAQIRAAAVYRHHLAFDACQVAAFFEQGRNPAAGFLHLFQDVALLVGERSESLLQ